MRSHQSAFCVVRVVLGAALLLLVVIPASAQQVGDKKTIETNFNNAARQLFKKYNDGEEQLDGKTEVKNAQAAAQYYIYRITHRAGVEAKAIIKIQEEFSEKTTEMMGLRFDKSVRNNRAFIKVFGAQLVNAMKEVMAVNPVKNDTATTAIQAAMMLPAMARLKDESIEKYLTGLVKDTNTHDAVRLYALKALKEAMPITVQPGDLDLDLENKAQNAKRKRDANLVETLTTYIENNAGAAKGKSMTPDEIAAVRFVRREAIIALAHAGAPAVLVVKKGGKLEAPVAPTLMRVLVKGGLDPAPSLQEKIEAAIGLCNMRHPNMPEYDPGVATYLVGRTLLEFIDDYNRELAAIAAVGPGRKLPRFAYRNDAKRLSEALTELARNAKYKGANELKTAGQLALANLLNAKTAVPYPALDNVPALRQLVQSPTVRPKDGTVFRNLKGAPTIPLD